MRSQRVEKPLVGVHRIHRRHASTSRTVDAGSDTYAKAEAVIPLIVKAELEAAGGVEISRTDGTENGEVYVERALAVSLSGTAAGNIFGAEIGGERRGIGVMKVRHNANGEATQVTLVTTRTGNFRATLGQPNGLADFAGLKTILEAQVDGGGTQTVLSLIHI